MCKTHARPYLDYNSVSYSPNYFKLINAVEHVQRHFPERLHGLNNFKLLCPVKYCRSRVG